MPGSFSALVAAMMKFDRSVRAVVVATTFALGLAARKTLVSGSMRMPASAEPLCSADETCVVGTFTVWTSDSFRPTPFSAVSNAASSAVPCWKATFLPFSDAQPVTDELPGADQLVRAARVSPPRHRHQALLGGLREDQRGAADEAGVDRAGLKRLQHRRATDERRILDLVREILVLAALVEQVLEGVQLVADAQGRAGRNGRRKRGG